MTLWPDRAAKLFRERAECFVCCRNVSVESDICPYCGHTFSYEEREAMKNKGNAKFLKSSIVGVVVFTAILVIFLIF